MLEPDAIKVIRASLANPYTSIRDASIIMILMNGIKAEQITRLTWQDFDGLTLVTKRKTLTLGNGALDSTLNYKSWLDLRYGTIEDHAPIFTSMGSANHGDAIAYSGIYCITRRIGDIAGITRLSPRMLNKASSHLQSVEAEYLRILDLHRHVSGHNYRKFARHISI